MAIGAASVVPHCSPIEQALDRVACAAQSLRQQHGILARKRAGKQLALALYEVIDKAGKVEPDSPLGRIVYGFEMSPGLDCTARRAERPPPDWKPPARIEEDARRLAMHGDRAALSQCQNVNQPEWVPMATLRARMDLPDTSKVRKLAKKLSDRGVPISRKENNRTLYRWSVIAEHWPHLVNIRDDP